MPAASLRTAGSTAPISGWVLPIGRPPVWPAGPTYVRRCPRLFRAVSRRLGLLRRQFLDLFVGPFRGGAMDVRRNIGFEGAALLDHARHHAPLQLAGEEDIG